MSSRRQDTHPSLRDATLVAHKDFRFPSIPGLQQPTFVPGGYRADVPAPYSAMPFLLPKVDADGNDVAGIRLPIVSVPLGTLTGWQFRSAQIGAPSTLIAMAGALHRVSKDQGGPRAHEGSAPFDSGAIRIARRVCRGGCARPP